MTKAVIFDFDGTLTNDNNTWYKIWNELNMRDVDDYLYDKYKKGEFTYDEWVEEAFKYFIKGKLNKSIIIKVAKETKPINNIEQTFKLLNEKGIKIYVLSGGIKNVIEIVLDKSKKYINSIEAHNLKLNNLNCVVGYENPDHNLHNKQEYIKRIIEQLNIKPEELLFVGNDWIDETACKTGCQTLCINPEETNANDKSIWHDHLETDNLLDIMKFVK